MLAARERWDGVCKKGSPSRIHRVIELGGATMYVCPNKVGVLVPCGGSDYAFVSDVSKGCRIEKDAPLMKIAGNTVSFPFAVKVIESWNHGERAYAGVFQVLR